MFKMGFAVNSVKKRKPNYCPDFADERDIVEHLVVLLAGPISHTSTQYIDFVDFLHFNGSVHQLFLLILVGVELPSCVVVTLS